MEFLIPSRISRPADDPIFALNTQAKARAAAGEPVVNATVGALLDEEGKLAVLGGVAQALRELPAAVGAAYAPIAGAASFREAVIADLLGGRPEASWALSVATPGGTGALRLAMANFLDRGQSALTTSYYWGPYRTLAEEEDRALATFRMFRDDGRLDTADFERRLAALVASQRRAVVVLNSPCHNPTGYSFDDEEWRQIVDVIERVGAAGAEGSSAERVPITLVLDVAYARYGAGGLTGCLDQVLRLGGKAMILFAWSASKAFTQYGLRVGALVGVHPDPDERARVEAALSYSCRGTWSNCNAGGMAAITRALTDPELRVRVDAERAALKALLDRRAARWNELAPAAKLRYPRYDGGFFITVFCDDAQAAAARLREEGVFVVPIAGGLRVGLCSLAERDIPRVVDAMARQVAR